MKWARDGSSEKDWLAFQDKQNQPAPIIENKLRNFKNALISTISVLAVLQDNRNLNMNPEPCLMA